MNGTGRVAASAVAALVALGLAGCGAPTRAEDPGDAGSTPSTAHMWFAARDLAQRQGVEDLMSFYDPEAVLDYRALGYPTAQGRLAALEFPHLGWPRGARQRARGGQMFLSDDSALTLERVHRWKSGEDEDAVIVYSMGTHGITAETAASPLTAWRRTIAADSRTIAVTELVEDYLSAWSSGSGDPISGLYADRAHVSDVLGATTATGRAAIGALVTSSGSVAMMRSMQMVDLPNFGGPATFVSGAKAPKDAPVTAVALLLAPDSPDSCPGHLAVVLTLDPEGAILTEQRYHRVDDLARCSTPSSLPSAWWDGLDVPDPLPDVRTGTLRLGGNTIEVFNGTGQLGELLAWGFTRFEAAGLTAPGVSRVSSHYGWSDGCSGIRGLTLNDAVTLCFEGTSLWCADGCTRWVPRAKETLLHEFAHTWMAEHVDQAIIAEFLRLSGLATWADRDEPWEDRGVELAAETIAWDLMDEPAPMAAGLRQRTCAQRAVLFETLTGVPADPGPVCLEPRELQQ